LVWGLSLWDAATGKRLRRLPTPGESATAVAFSRDSRRVAAGTGSGVHVWDLRSGAEFAPDDASHHGDITQVLASSRGLIATASGDMTLRV
jgi:WD40 repeat protein